MGQMPGQLALNSKRNPLLGLTSFGRFTVQIHEMSNEKRVPGCSGYIGDEIRPSYAGIFMNHYKDPVFEQAVQWKVKGFLFVAQIVFSFVWRFPKQKIDFTWEFGWSSTESLSFGRVHDVSFCFLFHLFSHL